MLHRYRSDTITALWWCYVHDIPIIFLRGAFASLYGTITAHIRPVMANSRNSSVRYEFSFGHKVGVQHYSHKILPPRIPAHSAGCMIAAIRTNICWILVGTSLIAWILDDFLLQYMAALAAIHTNFGGVMLHCDQENTPCKRCGSNLPSKQALLQPCFVAIIMMLDNKLYALWIQSMRCFDCEFIASCAHSAIPVSVFNKILSPLGIRKQDQAFYPIAST